MAIFSTIINDNGGSHYRGWNYIIENLREKITLENDGLILDTFVDDCLWKNDKHDYITKWVGIVHAAITGEDHSIELFLNCDWFKRNSCNCVGLITLSEYTKNYLKAKTNTLIYNTHHTKDIDCFFDIEGYFTNPTIRHAGFHSRDFSSFAKFNTHLQKAINAIKQQHVDQVNRCLDRNSTLEERQTLTITTGYLDDIAYNKAICQSIGFAYFKDAAASNAVLEYIMSHTPLIVNKHPAVVEYLGEEYPMYYENICDDPDQYLTSREFILRVTRYLKERSALDIFKFENFLSFFETFKLEDSANKAIPVYCINLQRATERREKMICEWTEKRNIHINFFDGVDRLDTDINNLPNPYNSERCKEILQQLHSNSYVPRFDKLTPGQICCVISHCNLLKELIESNIDEAIILEDDAMPLFESSAELFNTIHTCKTESDMVDILLLHELEEYAIQDFLHIKKSKENFNILERGTPCTQAIYYTRAGMLRAYEAGIRLLTPMDWIWEQGIVQEDKLGIIKKPITKHTALTTYIEDDAPGRFLVTGDINNTVTNRFKQYSPHLEQLEAEFYNFYIINYDKFSNLTRKYIPVPWALLNDTEESNIKEKLKADLELVKNFDFKQKYFTVSQQYISCLHHLLSDDTRLFTNIKSDCLSYKDECERILREIEVEDYHIKGWEIPVEDDFDEMYYGDVYPDVVNWYAAKPNVTTRQRLFHHYTLYGRDEGRKKNNNRPDRALTVITALLHGDQNIHHTAKSLQPFLDAHDIAWIIKYSKDELPEELKYLQQLKQTQVVCCSDSSIYDGLNQALDVVKTTFFIVLGAGDTLTSNFSQNYNLLAKTITPTTAFLFFAVYFDEFKVTRYPYPHSLPNHMSAPHQGVVMRTSFAKQLGGFDTTYKIAADYDLVLRCLAVFPHYKTSDRVISTFRGSGVSEIKRTEGWIECCLIQLRNLAYRKEGHYSNIIHTASWQKNTKAYTHGYTNFKQIYTIYSPTHMVFKPWFETIYKVYPDIKINYNTIEQVCPTGRYRAAGWTNIAIEKIKRIIEFFDDPNNHDDYFVYSDIDMQFFAPFDDIIETKLKNNDIAFQSDLQGSSGVCTGFFACRKTDKVKQLFNDCLNYMQTTPCVDGVIVDDQTAMNICLEQAPDIKYDVFLNTFFNYCHQADYSDKFAGIWTPGDEIILPPLPIAIHHANWTIGIDNKILMLEYIKNKYEQREQEILI